MEDATIVDTSIVFATILDTVNVDALMLDVVIELIDKLFVQYDWPFVLVTKIRLDDTYEPSELYDVTFRSVK